VAKAQEFTACCVVGCGSLGMMAIFYVMQQISENAHNFGSCSGADVFERVSFALIGFLCAILLPLFMVSVAVEMLQVGWTFKISGLKWERISVSAGICRLFGFNGEKFSIWSSAVGESIKFLLIAIPVLITTLFFSVRLLSAEDFMLSDLPIVLGLVSLPILILVTSLSLALYALSVLQRNLRLRMTLEELKQEHRDSEGRPEIKNLRNKLFEELASTAGARRPSFVVVGGSK